VIMCESGCWHITHHRFELVPKSRYIHEFLTTYLDNADISHVMARDRWDFGSRRIVVSEDLGLCLFSSSISSV
jgi:hypothetical protein